MEIFKNPSSFEIDKVESLKKVEKFLIVLHVNNPLQSIPSFKGLMNLGATCYANSLLQLVTSIKPF